MAVTSTATRTLKLVLDEANPNDIADALGQIDLGTILTPNDTTITQAAATTLTLSPAALMVQSVRVVAGVAALGVRSIGDAGSTPSVTVAALSADGSTLTFEATVTSVRVKWLAQPATSLAASFAKLPT